MTQQTLILDTTAWDLVLDASGNIAVASFPYAAAQDAASEIRTFLGEVYYDTTRGVPYKTTILGQFPSLTYVKAQMVKAALNVPDIFALGASAVTCFISAFKGRVFSGQVQVTDSSNTTVAVNF